jgi:hypothetical protein
LSKPCEKCNNTGENWVCAACHRVRTLLRVGGRLVELGLDGIRVCLESVFEFVRMCLSECV